MGFDRPLGETAERDGLTARADRLGQWTGLVGDEHDDGVVGRLLEVFEERVRRVLVHGARRG